MKNIHRHLAAAIASACLCAASANAARLLRSAKKWQTEHGAPISDAELAALAALLRPALA